MKRRGLCLPPEVASLPALPPECSRVMKRIAARARLPSEGPCVRVLCILLLSATKCNLEIFTCQLLQIYELAGVTRLLQMRKLRLETIESVASGPPATPGRAGIQVQPNHVVKSRVRLSPGSLLISRATLNYIGLMSLGLSFFLCKMGLVAEPTQRGHWEDLMCDSARQGLS